MTALRASASRRASARPTGPGGGRGRGARPGRDVRRRVAVAVVCVFALLGHGLWAALPMPKAWVAETRALPQAWAGLPHDDSHSHGRVGDRLAHRSPPAAEPAHCGNVWAHDDAAPHGKGAHQDGPLDCPICKLAYGLSGLAATPGVAATAPWTLAWVLVAPDASDGVPQLLDGTDRARAPPLRSRV